MRLFHSKIIGLCVDVQCPANQAVPIYKQPQYHHHRQDLFLLHKYHHHLLQVLKNLIEAVITTDEEIGMEGATAIDLSMLKAKRMLNIDSEEEGILLTSCAGGMRTDCHIPVKKEASSDGICLEIRVGGLLGGHSGTEINKERTNAIQLLGITLGQILGKVPFHLVQIYGGEKDNAIPREACAIEPGYTPCVSVYPPRSFVSIST